MTQRFAFLFLAVLLTLLATPTYAQRFADDPGFPDTRALFDFDHDGTQDALRVVGDDNGHFLALTFSSTRSTLISDTIDWGVPGSRRWIDMDGDGIPDYCRFIGSGNVQKVACNLTRPPFGWTRDLVSPVTDWGYEETRRWTAAAPGGKGTFCRGIGDHAHPTTVCSSW